MNSFLICELLFFNEIKYFKVLLPAANLLQLQDVQDACCDFLQTQLHPTNCLGIKAFADLHGCMELLSSSESYIQQHFS
jgi:kelch-like protein 2/3